MDDNNRPDELLTPLEVAALLGANPNTVSSWAAPGRLKCIRTLGGHRRFRRVDVEQAIAVADRHGSTGRNAV